MASTRSADILSAVRHFARKTPVRAGQSRARHNRRSVMRGADRMSALRAHKPFYLLIIVVQLFRQIFRFFCLLRIN